MKSHFIFISIVCFHIFIFWGCRDSQNQYEAYQKQEFARDSLWVLDLNNNVTNLDTLNIIRNRISIYTFGSDTTKKMLLTKLRLANISLETGKIILDEFTDEVIKANIKKVVIPYGDYLDNSSKYEIQRTHQGYLNSVNRKAHLLNLKYGWDKADCLTIAERKIEIGMNKNMVIEAWGKPYDINRTIYATGTHEQWVYGKYNSSYVYFDNGLLTTIQN